MTKEDAMPTTRASTDSRPDDAMFYSVTSNGREVAFARSSCVAHAAAKEQSLFAGKSLIVYGGRVISGYEDGTCVAWAQ
jgi:hypothetical protein